MPRINSNGPSNALEAKERGDEPSPGTSSWTSGSRPAWSGTSGTTDRPSLVHIAENLSFPDLAPSHPSSTADSTDGSGHATGSSQPSLSGSSADSASLREATPDQVLAADLDAAEPELAAEPYAGLSSDEAMALARQEYFRGNFAESERLLAVAESRGEDPAALAAARGYLADARARALAASPPVPGGEPAGPSEEDPAAGGYLVP